MSPPLGFLIYFILEIDFEISLNQSLLGKMYMLGTHHSISRGAVRKLVPRVIFFYLRRSGVNFFLSTFGGEFFFFQFPRFFRSSEDLRVILFFFLCSGWMFFFFQYSVENFLSSSNFLPPPPPPPNEFIAMLLSMI